MSNTWKTPTDVIQPSLDDAPITDIDDSTIETTETPTTEIDTDEKGKETHEDKANPHEQFYNAIIGKPIKAGGTEVVFESEEEVIKGLQKSVDYTQKMQKIAPLRGTIDLLKTNGILEDSSTLPLLIEAFKGNKEAISRLASMNGVDTIVDNEEYEPKIRELTDVELDLTETVDALKTKGTYDKVYEVASKLDDKSIELIQNTPSVLNLIEQDLESGMYTKVMSELNKQKILGTYDTQESDLVNYQRAFLKLQGINNDQTQNTPLPKPTNNTNLSSVRSTNNTVAPKVNKTPNVIPLEAITQEIESMAGMSDEEWLKKFK